jgi:beta-glucosidase
MQESVPWYPTPLGGTGAAWQESYTKAHDMVERMTLVEKVNVTTGTGWQMGLCVGNTGMELPSIRHESRY